jgi:hypothetical protein
MEAKNIGTTFDSWLRDEGIYEEASAAAVKRVIARQAASPKSEMSGNTGQDGGCSSAARISNE